MTLYKINIDNRNYGSWSIYNANTLEPVSIDGFEPIGHKLFNNDIFTYNKCKVEIVHSSIRVSDNIPAVLIIEGNKTYGRTKLNNNKGRLLYKCIPDDTRIPVFLVPYEIVKLGFSKVLTNLYVTIHYDEWDEKHPIAKLTQTIGPVDVLDNFYEYQLYCKSLNTSIQKFNKATNKAIKDHVSSHDLFIESIYNKYPSIEDRTKWTIFSIDPPNSLDFDDAFSITKQADGTILLSIYIANVTIWMDALNLWSSFSQRISTIYLPDRKRPMLPTILSDCLCSLQANTRRFTFTMDIVLNNDNQIVSIQYKNCLVRVTKNFAYEEHSLLENVDYKLLFHTVEGVSKVYKYISNIRNSHDVVCYLMIFMNYHCAKDLLSYSNGIFRSTISKVVEAPGLPSFLPDDVSKFIKIWNSTTSQYIDIRTLQENNISDFIKHELLEIDAYTHITSPIRRLVDLLNIIQFQENRNMITLSPQTKEFYKKWIQQIDYINTTMRAIRRVQNDCSLLDLCYNNPEILDKSYDGFCFDKLERNDGLFQFMVFLPELKLTSRITIRESLNNYDKKQYKLYLFSDEEKFKKKIRLQLL